MIKDKKLLTVSYFIYSVIAVVIFLLFLKSVTKLLLIALSTIQVSEGITFQNIIMSYVAENINIFVVWYVILVFLASYRLTRLFVKDSLFTPYRNSLRELKEKNGDGWALINTVFTCPWCFSVWGTLVIIVIPLLFGAYGVVLLFVLAISGLASFTTLLTNLIGWKAERSKQKAENHSN